MAILSSHFAAKSRMNKVLSADAPLSWNPPKEWIRLKTIESHAAGEPLRIVIEGWPRIPGRTMSAKRRYAKEKHDHLRRVLVEEPRGHPDMYGAILTEPVTRDGDLGVLFMHNEGFSTMCGHGVIALVSSLLTTGILRAAGANRIVRIDTPAGRVTARAKLRQGVVESVAFENVPSFVYARDLHVNIRGIGTIRYDVMFGGAFYAYCDANDLKVELTPRELPRLIELGMQVKLAVMRSLQIQHPTDKDLGFLYGTIICDKPKPDRPSRNVCIFANGQVDRSPTGTGVSGRVALEYVKGNLPLRKPLVVESVLGTRFTGKALRTTRVGKYEAIIPEIEGSAWTLGRNEYWIDPRDPLRTGFILR